MRHHSIRTIRRVLRIPRLTLPHLQDGSGGLVRSHRPLQPNGLHREQIAKATKVSKLAPMMLHFAHKGAFSGYSKAARLTLRAQTRTYIYLAEGRTAI